MICTPGQFSSIFCRRNYRNRKDCTTLFISSCQNRKTIFRLRRRTSLPTTWKCPRIRALLSSNDEGRRSGRNVQCKNQWHLETHLPWAAPQLPIHWPSPWHSETHIPWSLAQSPMHCPTFWFACDWLGVQNNAPLRITIVALNKAIFFMTGSPLFRMNK